MRSRWIVVATLAACGGNPAPAPSSPEGAAPERATADRSDDASGYQVHAIYAVPSDGEDHHFDTDGSIARSVAAMNSWLATRANGTHLRVDTAGGALDVSFVALPQTGATYASKGDFIRDSIEKDIEAAGFADANKLYAVYYDGTTTSACASGAWPPTLVGHAVVAYLQGAPPGSPPCDSEGWAASETAPRYREVGMLHEVFHALGAAPECAPNHTRAGHTSDTPRDLMYAGDEGWEPTILDEGHDDYWGHGRADCPDLSRSVFLDPTPANAAKPPGW